MRVKFKTSTMLFLMTFVCLGLAAAGVVYRAAPDRMWELGLVILGSLLITLWMVFSIVMRTKIEQRINQHLSRNRGAIRDSERQKDH